MICYDEMMRNQRMKSVWNTLHLTATRQNARKGPDEDTAGLVNKDGWISNHWQRLVWTGDRSDGTDRWVAYEEVRFLLLRQDRFFRKVRGICVGIPGQRDCGESESNT